MPLPLAPRATPPKQAPLRGRAPSDSEEPSGVQSATALAGRIFGFTLLGIAIWGFWVAADIVRHANTSTVGAGANRLNIGIFLLSWMVLFGPFFYFGWRILRSSLASEERSWLIPLRVFTYLVGKRLTVEKQRKEFFNNPPPKPLPLSGSQDYLDMPPAGPKDGNSGTSE